EQVRARPDPVLAYVFATALTRSGMDPAGPEGGEAVEALRAALAARPDFAPARAELGRLLLRRGDLDGAVAELERAVAADPSSSAALYNLSQAYMKKGDRARAAEMAQRVSRLNAQERGEVSDAEVRRVVFRLVREGAAINAAPDATPAEAAAAAPTAAALAETARGLAASGRADEAIAAYQRALFLEPSQAEAANGLAGLCAALGDLDGAVTLMRRVVAAQPANATARYDLAVNLWNRHQTGTGLPRRTDLAD